MRATQSPSIPKSKMESTSRPPWSVRMTANMNSWLVLKENHSKSKHRVASAEWLRKFTIVTKTTGAWTPMESVPMNSRIWDFQIRRRISVCSMVYAPMCATWHTLYVCCFASNLHSTSPVVLRHARVRSNIVNPHVVFTCNLSNLFAHFERASIWSKYD